MYRNMSSCKNCPELKGSACMFMRSNFNVAMQPTFVNLRLQYERLYTHVG
jgi:hypothetical protein